MKRSIELLPGTRLATINDFKTLSGYLVLFKEFWWTSPYYFDWNFDFTADDWTPDDISRLKQKVDDNRVIIKDE